MTAKSDPSRRSTLERRTDYDGRRHTDKKGIGVPMPDRDDLTGSCIDRVVFDVQRRRVSAETARHALRLVIHPGWLPDEYFKEAKRGNVRLDDLKSLDVLQRRCRRAEQEIERTAHEPPAGDVVRERT